MQRKARQNWQNFYEIAFSNVLPLFSVTPENLLAPPVAAQEILLSQMPFVGNLTY